MANKNKKNKNYGIIYTTDRRQKIFCQINALVFSQGGESYPRPVNHHFSRSNAGADLRMPYRDGPRHEPFRERCRG